MSLGHNNLLYNNTADYLGWDYVSDDITGLNPLFVDAGNGNYALLFNSPARNAGWPSFLDLGAEQVKQDRVSRLGPTIIV